MKKLIKIEKLGEPIWYFTTAYKAAKFIGAIPCNVYSTLNRGTSLCKGWNIKYVEIDEKDIIPKYLNPGDKSPLDEILSTLNDVVELLKKNDERIENLEKQMVKRDNL